MTRLFCFIAVVAMLSAAGCASRAPSEVAEGVGETETPAQPAEPGPVEEQTPVPIDLVLEPLEGRMSTRTGDISLVVEDVAQSLKGIEAIVMELRGTVVTSSAWYEGGKLRATMTIRVPTGEFDLAMDLLERLAVRIENRNVFSQDVSEEHTDLDARLRNLESTEKELLALLTEVREQTGNAEDVLAVYRELTVVREQIEQIKGRMQYFEQMTAMATIDITLIPQVLTQPIVGGGWEPSGAATNALRALVSAFQFIVDGIIWLVIYVLPILLAVAIPLVIIWLIWRRWRGRTRFL